jgi:putative two-component system response regulator
MGNLRNRITLVDDSVANLDQGRNILKTFYEVFPAESAKKLFEILENIIPDLILLDIEMPEMDGYETIKKLKDDDQFKDIPVIFLTSKGDDDSEMEGLDLGAVDYVKKPFTAKLLLKRIEKELLFVQQKKKLLDTQAELKDHLDNLEELVHEKAETVMRLQNAVLATVVDMVEFRDRYTGGHIVRTERYLKVLIDEMVREKVYEEEVSKWDMTSILASAKLHDVGKIAVPDIILGKNAKLSAEEFESMKAHVTASVDAIERIISKTEEDELLTHAIRMAGTHHEKWNGSGYPIGLNGFNIPLEGRLMAIADVYDALISRRQYKEPLTHEDACKIIEDGSGTQFDPALIDVFRNVKDKFEQIATKFTS